MFGGKTKIKVAHVLKNGFAMRLNSYAAGCVSFASFNNGLFNYQKINIDLVPIMLVTFLFLLFLFLVIVKTRKINSVRKMFQNTD